MLQKKVDNLAGVRTAVFTIFAMFSIIAGYFFFLVSDDKLKIVLDTVFPPNHNKQFVTKWSEYPVNVKILPAEAIATTQQILQKINDQVGAEIVDFQQDKPAKIFLFLSGTPQPGHATNLFNDGLLDLVTSRYGSEVASEAKDAGLFSIVMPPENPCFTMSLYNPAQANDRRRQTGQLPADVKVINIAVDMGDSRLIQHCLFEEVGHAVFGIPDREISSPRESIFNLNGTHQDIIEYSETDLLAMHYLLSADAGPWIDRDGLTKLIAAKSK